MTTQLDLNIVDPLHEAAKARLAVVDQKFNELTREVHTLRQHSRKTMEQYVALRDARKALQTLINTPLFHT